MLVLFSLKLSFSQSKVPVELDINTSTALDTVSKTLENNLAIARQLEATAQIERARADVVRANADVAIVRSKAEGFQSALKEFGLFAALVVGSVIVPLITMKRLQLANTTLVDTNNKVQVLSDKHDADTMKVQEIVNGTKEKIDTIEVNTNNKMDKLLEINGAAKFAEGLKQGKEDKS